MNDMHRGLPFYGISALSGLAWTALVMFVLLEPQQREYFGRAWFLGPWIGVAAGQLSARFKNAGAIRMAAVALGSLYMTAALFGFASGVVLTIGGTADRDPFLLAFLMVSGLTVAGYVLPLWPLAYLNHRLVARFVGPKEPGLIDLGISHP
jgi:hypothetical protein